MNKILTNLKQSLPSPYLPFISSIRAASKKTGTSSRNKPSHPRPKHRGWKRQDGHWVESGTLLVTQNRLRFHPGLNVGLGRNGTLFAMIPGNVVITCEKTDLDWEHSWVKMCYANRENTSFFKKYYHVIPKRQHQNFKLIDQL